MSTAYQEFLKAQEDTRQLASDITTRINTNRAERTDLLQKFELAIINGKPTEEIRADIKRLDEDFEFLNLEAIAMTKVEETGPVIDMAHKVLKSNRKELDRMREEWAKTIKNIKNGQKDYLKLVAEAKAVYDMGQKLSRELVKKISVKP